MEMKRNERVAKYKVVGFFLFGKRILNSLEG